MSPLRRLALANIVVHFLGLLVAVLWMRPGSPAAPVAARIAYLSANPAGWSFAWSVWIGCMLLMVSFTAAVAQRLKDNTLARFAVMVAVAAGGFDLLGNAAFIVVLPKLASFQPPNEQLFLTVECFLQVLSLVVANGLYSVATLLLTLAAGERLKHFTRVLGVLVFVCGLLLASAAFSGLPHHAEAATGPTIGLYALWVWLTARDLEAA